MRPDPLPRPEQPALLTGLACCGFCGQPLRAERRPAGQVAYRCPTEAGRTHLRRSVAPVDGWVRLLVLQHLGRSGAPAVPGDSDLADLYALRAHSAGPRTRPLTPRVTHPLPASLTGADPVESAWDRLGPDRQRAVLEQLATRIALHPVPPGRRAGDPATLRGTVEVTWKAP